MESIVEGKTSSVEQLREVAPEALAWLKAKLPVAYKDPESKEKIKLLLGAPRFAPNLGHFGLWDDLMQSSKRQALKLGREMQSYYESANLRVKVGEAIPNLYSRLERDGDGETAFLLVASDDLETSLRRQVDSNRNETAAEYMLFVVEQMPPPFRRDGALTLSRTCMSCVAQDGILPRWPGPEAGLGGEESAVFPLNSGYSQQWNEMCYIHFLRMIAMGMARLARNEFRPPF